MASKNIVITGDEELDRALARLEPKLQKKHIKKATRNIAKQVLARARMEVPRDTGTLAASFQVKATSRSVVKDTGQRTSRGFRIKRKVGEEFGAKVEVNRKNYAKQAAKRGKKYDPDGDWFPPAHIELGTDDQSPNPTMRTALNAARPFANLEFQKELRKLIMSPK